MTLDLMCKVDKLKTEFIPLHEGFLLLRYPQGAGGLYAVHARGIHVVVERSRIHVVGERSRIHVVGERSRIHVVGERSSTHVTLHCYIEGVTLLYIYIALQCYIEGVTLLYRWRYTARREKTKVTE